MVERNGARGFPTTGDVAYLLNLAAGLPSGGRYLEVGSWIGLSSSVVANGLLANMNLHARIQCVDTWRGSAQHQGIPDVDLDGLYSQSVRNSKNAQVDSLIELIRGESGEVARTWRDEPLDLVFIDGLASVALVGAAYPRSCSALLARALTDSDTGQYR